MKFLNLLFIGFFMIALVSCSNESNNKSVGTQKVIEESVSRDVPTIQINRDSCLILLETYKNQIDQYLETKDLEYLKPIFKISNDKTYNNCLKDKNFKKQFESLENRIK